MKKVVLFLTFHLLLTSKGISQDDDRKGFTSINLGVSIPTGNYGSTDFNNSEAGYATTGLVIDYTFGHKISKNLGVSAILRSQANGVDVGVYAQGLANYLGASNPSESTSVRVKSSVYSLGGLLAGIYGTFPIANKLSFEPRAMVGFSAATLPSMTTEAFESGTKLTTFIQEQASTVAFSYIIGTGVKLNVSKRICVLLNLDFYAAKAKWENVQVIGIGHITGTTEIRYFDYNHNFGTVNISTGLGFRF
ncbi:MAG: hypothetical protein FJY17_05930 [Bacteroidetes bacterium]|nr:hypothetical protein [Bacteroidota bacterium]